jgi:hypothetical protein
MQRDERSSRKTSGLAGRWGANQGARWLRMEMRSNRDMYGKTGRCVAVGMGDGWQDKQ